MKVAVATVPELIVFVLNPATRQVVDPLLLLHETDLPAAEAAEPVLTLTPEKSAAE